MILSGNNGYGRHDATEKPDLTDPNHRTGRPSVRARQSEPMITCPLLSSGMAALLLNVRQCDAFSYEQRRRMLGLPIDNVHCVRQSIEQIRRPHFATSSSGTELLARNRIREPPRIPQRPNRDPVGHASVGHVPWTGLE
jgi:hypothetical protein